MGYVNYMSVMIFVSIVIVAILAVVGIKARNKRSEEIKTYPQGHFIGLGIAFGIPLGILIGFAIGNIALGPAIGVAIGIAIGAPIEKKHKRDIRPLSEEELKIKNRNLVITTIILAIGIATFFIIFTLLK